MTRHVVCTTCNSEQWEAYGRAMARTFQRHWPSSVPLWLYAEGFDPFGDVVVERAMNLEEVSPWLRDFKQRYAEPRCHGRANGQYDYRRDAVRFSHKVAAITAAAAEADCDVLIWLDADTVTHAPVTEKWLRGLFPKHATVAWLDRIGVYPECGFLMFRLPKARPLLKALEETYTSGAIFKMRETHDSFVIQQVFEPAQRRGEIMIHSLSGSRGIVNRGHPWVASPLAACLDHLKGARKEIGHTPEREIPWHRTEPYWEAIRRR